MQNESDVSLIQILSFTRLSPEKLNDILHDSMLLTEFNRQSQELKDFNQKKVAENDMWLEAVQHYQRLELIDLINKLEQFDSILKRQDETLIEIDEQAKKTEKLNQENAKIIEASNKIIPEVTDKISTLKDLLAQMIKIDESYKNSILVMQEKHSEWKENVWKPELEKLAVDFSQSLNNPLAVLNLKVPASIQQALNEDWKQHQSNIANVISRIPTEEELFSHVPQLNEMRHEKFNDAIKNGAAPLDAMLQANKIAHAKEAVGVSVCIVGEAREHFDFATKLYKNLDLNFAEAVGMGSVKFGSLYVNDPGNFGKLNDCLGALATKQDAFYKNNVNHSPLHLQQQKTQLVMEAANILKQIEGLCGKSASLLQTQFRDTLGVVEHKAHSGPRLGSKNS